MTDDLICEEYDYGFDATPLICFDTETTGFRAQDRITEIAFAVVYQDKIQDSWRSFVNPGMPIPEEVTAITGITDVMVKDAPFFEDIKPKVLEYFVRGAPLVAHNLDFDAKMLGKELTPEDVPAEVPMVCTQRVAERVLGPRGKNVRNYKLGTVCEYFGVEIGNAHRALDDAVACGRVAHRMLDKDNVGLRCTHTSDIVYYYSKAFRT